VSSCRTSASSSDVHGASSSRTTSLDAAVDAAVAVAAAAFLGARFVGEGFVGAGLVVTACGVALVACFVARAAALAGVAAPFPFAGGRERLGDAFCPAAVTAFVPASRLVRGDGVLVAAFFVALVVAVFVVDALCAGGAFLAVALFAGAFFAGAFFAGAFFVTAALIAGAFFVAAFFGAAFFGAAFARVGAVAFFGAGTFFFVEAAFAGAAFLGAAVFVDRDGAAFLATAFEAAAFCCFFAGVDVAGDFLAALELAPPLARFAAADTVFPAARSRPRIPVPASAMAAPPSACTNVSRPEPPQAGIRKQCREG
jgi:hypothetical protein